MALCLGGAMVIPWLNPVTSGPSTNMWPWLTSAVCAVIVWTFRRQLDADLVFLAVALAAGTSSAMGLLQYFGLAHGLSPWIAHTNPGEAFGNLRQRNQFATLTAIGLLALLGWLGRRASAGKGFGPTAWLALLLALGNASSSSRTGLLQWVLILGLMVWWNFGVRRPVMMLSLQAMMAYLIAAVALPWMLMVLAGTSTPGLFGRLLEGPSCASRSVLWSNVITLIGQKPWLGWGWGELDYAHYITLYDGPRFCEILDNAHNLPLHLAVELGIPAALAICGTFAWWVLRQRPWCETNLTRQLAWGVLAVVLLHSLLEYPLWYGPFQMAAGLCVLLLWRGTEEPPKYQPNKPTAQMMRSLVAVILIAIIGYSAWDYRRISQIYLAPEARDEAYRDDTLIKIRDSWLFRNQVRFAELSLTPLTRDNAQWTYDTAAALLHYSPEPRVIEKVIESAVLLGRDDEAVAHLVRYRAAFPADHARWAQANARLPGHLRRLN